MRKLWKLPNDTMLKMYVQPDQPTFMYSCVEWRVKHRPAGKWNYFVAFYIRFMCDFMGTFCRPGSYKTYQSSGTIRWSQDLRLIRADSVPNDISIPTYLSGLASCGWRLDVMSSQENLVHSVIWWRKGFAYCEAMAVSEIFPCLLPCALYLFSASQCTDHYRLNY